ncbi:MAG: hypothetical protein EOM50_20010 [Erysipelotrichia bacterium]|nr:hypothetical protein [Erysipelotrichia bacterium]
MNEQYLWLKEQFKQHADDKKAKAMADYMRNQFCFYGISKPQRSAIYKQLLKVAKHNKRVDWNFLDLCYEDEHREFQYFVCDYLLAVQKYLTYEDINHIKHYIINKSWWDISDCLDNVIGAIGLLAQALGSAPGELSVQRECVIYVRNICVGYMRLNVLSC